ncbi:hypothetical protein ACFYZ9_33540 [Streptomyces sp. NPDC001691]|uniref:hypothetical protein n=1 Tax=Streptomyces sp. NPDC001691 TaxID=3364600 RepID=UPI0036B2E570
MSTGPLQDLHIIEEDMGADSVVVEDHDKGVTYVFISPNQSFGSAVGRMTKTCPGMSQAEAQALIRKHCPSIREMNERLGTDQTVPRVEAAPQAGDVSAMPGTRLARERRWRWARIAAVAAPAVIGGAAAAHFLFPSGTSADLARPSTSISAPNSVADATYNLPLFKQIANRGKMRCDSIGPYEAKCVDADGTVMFSEASIGTSTAFTFAYGKDKIGFRIFPTEESAAAWVQEDANRQVFDNVSMHGRVVLWGTDPTRLKEWRTALDSGPRFGNNASAMSSQSPLPVSLASLAFGTLGVTEDRMVEAASMGGNESASLVYVVQLVMGTVPNEPQIPAVSGANDAVAIVVGAQDGASAKETHGGVTAVVAADPVPVRVPTPVEPVPATEPQPDVTRPPAKPTPPPAPDPKPAVDPPLPEPDPTKTVPVPPVAETKTPEPPAQPSVPVDPPVVVRPPADPTPAVPEEPVLPLPVTSPDPQTPTAPPVEAEPDLPDGGAGAEGPEVRG